MFAGSRYPWLGFRFYVDSQLLARKFGSRSAELAIECERIAARLTVEKVAASEAPVYGVNTGFGDLASVRIDPLNLLILQELLSDVGNRLAVEMNLVTDNPIVFDVSASRETRLALDLS